MTLVDPSSASRQRSESATRIISPDKSSGMAFKAAATDTARRLTASRASRASLPNSFSRALKIQANAVHGLQAQNLRQDTPFLALGPVDELGEGPAP